MYRAIYRLRIDGDWDLVAVFGLDVTEDNTPLHRLKEIARLLFGEDTYKEFKYDNMNDVVDVLDGEETA